MYQSVEGYISLCNKPGIWGRRYALRINGRGLSMTSEEYEAKLELARDLYKKQRKEIKDLTDEVTRLKAKLNREVPIVNEYAIDRILDEHPKRRNQTTSREAVKMALKKMEAVGGTAEDLLEITKRYAKCLKRFDMDKNHKDWKFIPASHNFYYNEMYDLDEAEWSAPFRKGKYVEELIQKDIPPEHPLFREALKHCFPNCIAHNVRWSHFYFHNPEERSIVDGWIMKKEKGQDE